MSNRPTYEALKAAFLQPLGDYSGADELAGDCAQIALDALDAELGISERDMDQIAGGERELCDGVSCREDD